MKNKKRGRIEFILGIIIIGITLITGISLARKASIQHATEFGYAYILAPTTIGIIIGLFSGLLIYSGYTRISDKQK